MKKSVVVFVSAALFATGIAGCHSAKGDKEAAAGGQASAVQSGEKVRVDLWVMSQCPYGVQAEQVIMPVVEEFKDRVDFHIGFVGDEPEPGILVSMHGESELKGDLIQICALKHSPDKFGALLDCMNQEFERIPDNFAECAEKTAVKTDLIKACADGDEGRILLMESFKAGNAAKVEGSPTIRINGTEYDGPRTADGFMRSLCSAFGENKPELCRSIPEPKKIAVTIITDKRCERCMQIAEIAPKQLVQIFPGLAATVLDWADQAGKDAYKPLAGGQYRYLPAIIFDKAVKEDPAFAQLEPYFIEAGDQLLLAAEADFDPAAEICDNKVDDDNNGKVDCADDGCRDKLVCRKEIKGRLDLFVMSQCPYGAEAVLSMKEVLEAFGKDMTLGIHFLAAEPFPGQFQSLHGPSEVAEDLRQICVLKYYAKKNQYMDYFLCRAADYRSDDWEKCATGSIKADVIRKCSEGEEGRALLSADIKMAEQAGMNASPTWIANNNSMFNGISAAEIQEGFCKVNPGLKGCTAKLTEDSKVPSGACGQ